MISENPLLFLIDHQLSFLVWSLVRLLIGHTRNENLLYINITTKIFPDFDRIA